MTPEEPSVSYLERAQFDLSQAIVAMEGVGDIVARYLFVAMTKAMRFNRTVEDIAIRQSGQNGEVWWLVSHVGLWYLYSAQDFVGPCSSQAEAEAAAASRGIEIGPSTFHTNRSKE